MVKKYYTNGIKMLSLYANTSLGSQPWAPSGYWKAINGTTYRGVAWDSTSSTFQNEKYLEINPLTNLVFYPSSDGENDFNVNQTALSNTIGTYSQAIASDYSSVSNNYVVTISSSSDITVNSFQVTKKARLSNGTSWTDNLETLICSIFLDTPVQISAGETKTVTLTVSLLA